jgi:hypothetical protein
VTVDKDGSNGEYVFTVTAPGTYTIAVSPPPGYIVDPNRPATASSFDPSDGPTPTVLGSADATGGPGPDGTLDDFSTIANPYYLTFEMETGDPIVLTNNIPVILKPTTGFNSWQTTYNTVLGGQTSPTQNPDGDICNNLLGCV